MRKEFGSFITKLAKNDKNIILMVGDIGYAMFDELRKQLPQQFINIGICEQSMISIAAGLALSGFKVYVYTITPFLAERPFEQIKIDINLNKANVNLIGYDDYAILGPTHMVTDDGKFMKMFKNIKCYYPKTIKELRSALKESYELECPTFIRMKEPIK